MFKRPNPNNGKLSFLANKEQCEQQVQTNERQRERQELLRSLKNNSTILVVALTPGMPFDHNARYAICIASTEKSHSIELLLVMAGSRKEGIADVTKKTVFDFNGGKSKMPLIAKHVAVRGRNDSLDILLDIDKANEAEAVGRSLWSLSYKLSPKHIWSPSPKLFPKHVHLLS
jgi:hypothetical protein